MSKLLQLNGRSSRGVCARLFSPRVRQKCSASIDESTPTVDASRSNAIALAPVPHPTSRIRTGSEFRPSISAMRSSSASARRAMNHQ
jgi:hypothetical protein